MATNRKQLDLICEHIDKLYAYIAQQGAQITTLSNQLKVCQNNCYILYLENEKRKKEERLVTFGYDEELQSEIDQLACDIAEEKRRQDEVRIIEGENPQGWGEGHGKRTS